MIKSSSHNNHFNTPVPITLRLPIMLVINPHFCAKRKHQHSRNINFLARKNGMSRTRWIVIRRPKKIVAHR